MDCDPKRKEFLDELFLFMIKRGTPITRLPKFDGEVADIFAFFNAVVKHGGLLEVMKQKLSRTICDELGISYHDASTFENKYIENLYPFEREKYQFSTPPTTAIDTRSSGNEERNSSDDNNKSEDISNAMALEALDPSKLEQMSAEDLKKHMEKMVKVLQIIENETPPTKSHMNEVKNTKMVI